jgi:hypothetical protein
MFHPAGEGSVGPLARDELADLERRQLGSKGSTAQFDPTPARRMATE